MFICKLNLNFYSNFTFSLYLAFLLILQTSVHYLFFLLDLLGINFINYKIKIATIWELNKHTHSQCMFLSWLVYILLSNLGMYVWAEAVAH